MRSRLCCSLLLLALGTHAFAAEKWVFLKDGRLCFSTMEGDPCSGRLPDGSSIQFSKDLVQGTRTVEQVEQAVDAMIAEMVLGKNIEDHAARFKVFRASAVPALLKHLAMEPINERLSALYGLCFSWSPAALDPVMKAFRGGDARISRAAFSALERNLPVTDLGNRVKDLADDPDIAKAAIVFRAVEQTAPDPTLKRIRRLMATPEGRSAVAPYLPHYFALDLVPGMLELLASEKIEERRCAVLGLISASATDEKTRIQLSKLLHDSDAELRQLAGEYFARAGIAADIPILQDTAKAEENVYAKAAFEAAIRVIKARAQKRGKIPETLNPRWSALKDSDTPAAKLRACLEVLKGAPGAKDIPKAWQVFRDAVSSEPQHWYSGNAPAWHDAICLRNAVERLLEVAPCGDLENADEKTVAPGRLADRFIPPIDAYFDPKRKSFGFQIPTSGGLFADSVHIGDDCGWHRELRTIVSAANGVVRRVAYVPSWGHIVIIEHALKDGTHVCSLYGHVSPFIYVRVGESVDVGQKIAAIGRENTIENGGFGAHLHFAIHAGAYDPNNWICGYVSRSNFAGGKHGWLNPQAFLEEHR